MEQCLISLSPSNDQNYSRNGPLVPFPHGIEKKKLPRSSATIKPIGPNPPRISSLQLTLNEVDLFPQQLAGKNHEKPLVSRKIRPTIKPLLRGGGGVGWPDMMESPTNPRWKCCLKTKKESTGLQGRRKILSSKGWIKGPLQKNICVTATLTHQCKKSRFGKVQPKRFCRHTGQMNPSTHPRWLKTMAQQYQRGDKHWQTCFKRLQ